MIDAFYDALHHAESRGLMLKPPEAVLSGFSGTKLIGALQRLSALFTDEPAACYLEVGVFQGLTLLSTAYANPDLPCYGIDNFAYFDKDGRNESIITHVRQANHDFLVTNSDFKLIFEAYTLCHPLNMDQSSRALATNGWWNGVHVIMRDPEDQVPAMFPPTVRERLLFENDHNLHSSPLAHHFPATANRCMSYIRAGTLDRPKRGLSLLRWLSGLGKDVPTDCFARANTWSRGLPEFRFNPGLPPNDRSRT